MASNSEAPESSSAALRLNIPALGLVSLLTDVSSEMVYAINPVFLTKVLGAPPAVLGLIEGAAESAASLLRPFSGYLSDRSGRRKPNAILGYSLSAVSKPLLALAAAWPLALLARLSDRVGKGLRSAPRDALLAESCPPEQRGSAFGLHRAMDTCGAVIGPFLGWLALASMEQTPSSLRWLYWLGLAPALLGILALALLIKEPVREVTARREPRPPSGVPSFPRWRDLSPALRRYLLIVGLFSIGNSSDAFLFLRASDAGMSASQILLLSSGFNMVEALLAYPAGRLSDRIGRRPLVSAGYIAFAIAYLGFSTVQSAGAIWGWFLVYGFYFALTQGTQRALAADLANPERRATEIGGYHFVVGALAFPSSLLAGALYQANPAAPFLLGAVCACLASFALAASSLDRPKAAPVN